MEHNVLFPLCFTSETKINRGLSIKEASKVKCKYKDKIIKNPKNIPKRDSRYKITLIWDLDQTLVSADGIEGDDIYSDETKLVIRPYTETILASLKRNDDVEFVIWTAGNKSHAKRVLNSFNIIYFDYIIYRNETWFDINDQIKDIKLLNRDLKNTILIDDRIDIGKMNPENLLVVPPFKPREQNCDNDTTLLYLANILQKSISDYRKNGYRKTLSCYLYSPLTDKYEYEDELYFGVRCFSSHKELDDRIKKFRKMM